MSNHTIQKAPQIPLRDALRRLSTMSTTQQVIDMVGKRVRVQEYYHGVVLRLNDSPYGAFPGNVYPVIVRLDEDFRGHRQKEHAFRLSDIVIDE